MKSSCSFDFADRSPSSDRRIFSAVAAAKLIAILLLDRFEVRFNYFLHGYCYYDYYSSTIEAAIRYLDFENSYFSKTLRLFARFFSSL